MTTSAFLDTGVVLGYCFTLDNHFSKCNNYIENCDGKDLFTSNTVESEYNHRKTGLNRELSNEVMKHRTWVLRAGFEGQLGPVDLRDIKQDYLNRSWDSYNSLHHWYSNEVEQFIHIDDLLDRLERMARQIEANAIKRKQQLYQDVTVWTLQNSHSAVDDALTPDVPEDDRQICIEAHDVAVENGEETELATINPSDLWDDGLKDLILQETDLSDVIDLAVRN